MVWRPKGEKNKKKGKKLLCQHPFNIEDWRAEAWHIPTFLPNLKPTQIILLEGGRKDRELHKT